MKVESEKMAVFRERSKKIQGFKFDLRKKATLSEIAFKKALKSHKIKCQFQRPFHSKSFKCIADFFFKSDNTKIVVEIDGGYHNSEEQIRKDKYREKWLTENRGCHIIRFTNAEVLNNPDECLRMLAFFYLKISNTPLNPSDNYIIFNTLIKQL